MQHPPALIISPDAVTAALIGSTAELAGLEAEFRSGTELVLDALRRSRPAVVLADCESDESLAESFVGLALMSGASLAFFCAPSASLGVARARAVAERHGLTLFALPDDVEALHAYLADIAGRVQRSRAGGRR